MLEALKKVKWKIVVLFIAVIIIPIIKTKLNLLSVELFDMAGIKSAVYKILGTFTLIFLLWIFRRLIIFIQNILQVQILQDIRIDIKTRIFGALFKLDLADISSAENGKCITMLTSEIEILENKYFSSIIQLFSDVCSIVILSVSFLSLQKTIAAAILVIGVVAMLTPVIFTKWVSKKTIVYTNKLESFTNRIKEYFSAYATIKNFGVELEIIKKFQKENRETEEKKFDAEATLSIVNNIGAFFSWFMQFIAVAVGIILVLNDEITIGVVIAAQEFAGDLGMPFQTVTQRINAIRSVKLLVHDLNKVMVNKGESFTSQENESVDEDQGTLTFDSVGLSIHGQVILTDFTYTFNKGKKYLIIGRNGSGKSSLFKLLKKGFHEYEGNIFVGYKNLRDMGSMELGNKVSYLRENIDIFSASVMENIILFKEDRKEKSIEVARQARLGLDMDRQIQPENVSSGEQRRIEIARSLYKMADIMIFDEVISTLDIETAYDIEKLALMFKNKTVIVISHNFSGKLLREYDAILVMEDGRLMDSGSYDELIGRNSYFKKICEIKFGEWGE